MANATYYEANLNSICLGRQYHGFPLSVMGILLGVSVFPWVCSGLGFRVSALNRVCPSVRLFVRPISYWLEDCPMCDWTEGRKGGEFSLSLINTNEEVSSLSLTHTHSFTYVNGFNN